jgi:hypothetical protein
MISYQIEDNINKNTPESKNLSGQLALSRYICDIFESFKKARLPWEEIWEECWYNYLGQYQPHLNWKKKTEGTANRSRIFVKLTTLKCNTAHSKITDVLFGNSVNIPFETKAYNTEGTNLNSDQIKELVRISDERLKDHFKTIKLHEIYDTSILELAILGTAVLKGPIVETQKKQRVVQRMINGVPVSEVAPDVSPYTVQTYTEIVPVIDPISLWEYYVDVNAKNPESSIGEIHFQRLLPSQFKLMAYQGGYIKDNVLEAARRATISDANDKRYIQLADNYTGESTTKDSRVSVLEYWGLVPVKMLEDAGVELPPDADEEDSIEALVVLAADGVVIKACINPLGHRPFYVCPYKKRPHVIYGMGVAEAMRDSQKMINSAARMIIDNKALSGNGMVGINLNRIDTARMKNDFTVYSGKTWYVKGNFSPKEAIDSITFADVTGGLRELMEMFERFSDEETGIPKYTNGEQNNFLNKTASGMSMLMTQANINLKTAIKNIDIYWTEPIVAAFNEWFATFGFSDGFIPRIPLKTIARGSDSLIAKELRMENLMRFMQVTQNKEDAIFMDRTKLIKEIANILETRDVMRSDEEIKQIMETMNKLGSEGKDWREIVDIDRLYPYLARSEQAQILTMMGIKPSDDSNELAELTMRNTYGTTRSFVPPGLAGEPA